MSECQGGVVDGGLVHIDFMGEFVEPGAWASMPGADERSQRWLALAQSEFVCDVRHASTLRGFRKPWRQYRIFVARALLVRYVSVYPRHFAHRPGLIFGYLAKVLITTCTKTTVARVAQAIRFVFELNGLQDPTGHTIVATLCKAV